MQLFNGQEFDSILILKLGFGLSEDGSESAHSVLKVSDHWKFPVVNVGRCTEIQMHLVVTLWEQLVESEQARCHTPGYAIQLLSGKEPIFIAALCWHCNNISMSCISLTKNFRTFDSSSKAAVSLLRLCENVAGKHA